MTSNQEQPNIKRLRKKYEALREQWNVYHDKLSYLHRDLAIETDTANKFKLRKQIEEEETQLENIDNLLHNIEQRLQQPGHSQNAENQQELSNTEISEIDQNIKQAQAKLRKFKKPAIISSFFSFLTPLRIKLYTGRNNLIILIVLFLGVIDV